MNKDKLILAMKIRQHNLTEKINKERNQYEINQLANRLFELEKWLEKIECDEFENE